MAKNVWDFAMTAADAAPLTCAAEARTLSCCTCWEPSIIPPDDGRGPLKDGSHFANCPSENVADIAAALRARQMRGRREAGAVVKGYLGCDAIADRIAALPEVL